MLTTLEIAQSAKSASRILAPLDESRRNAALEAMAVAVEGAQEALIAANAKDLEVAVTMSGDLDAVSGDSVVNKLFGCAESLNEDKISEARYGNQ